MLLKAGRLVALPTETVYGLGADAFNAAAVARVFEVKQRPHFDPLIVHLADRTWLDQVVAHVPEAARALMSRFWPGPLTVVLPKQPRVPDLVTAGLETVAVRLPAHENTREVITRAGTPVAAPSANVFGRISPTTAAHVAEQLAEHIDYILDGGACRVGVESTVVGFPGDDVMILRPGGVTLEQIREVVPAATPAAPEADESQPASPGRTLSHYAPRTPLVIREDPRLTPDEQGARVGLLTNREAPAAGFARVERLDHDLTAAAAEFFAALRRLDAAGLDLIVATPFPESGLGVALNDRLRRASARDRS